MRHTNTALAKRALERRGAEGRQAGALKLPERWRSRTRLAFGTCALALLLCAVLATCLPLHGAQEKALAAKAAVTTQSEDVTLSATRAAIAALPTDPRAVINDTDNGTVASAATLYNALAAGLKGKLTNDERLHLARCAIIVLPSDPYEVTSSCKRAIATAQRIVDSLPAALRSELDSDEDGKVVSSSKSYGRYLENAEWALDSLKAVNNATGLAPGTYTGQVSSTSSLGKSTSRRALSFTVESVQVIDGQAFATIVHSSNTSDTLRLGGVEYKHYEVNTSDRSHYYIPVELNSTFHFSVKGKGATAETDAISYEMTVQADEYAMSPDADEGADYGDAGDGGGNSAIDKPSNGKSGDSNDGDKGNGGSKNGNDKNGGNDDDTKSNDDDKKNDNGGNGGNGSNDGNGNNGDGAGNNNGGGNSNGAGNNSLGNMLGGGSGVAGGSGSAGNLASLVKGGTSGNNNASGGGNANAKASGSAATNAAGSRTSSTFGAAADDAGASVKELAFGSSADGVAGARSVDLSPAIAGGILLCISLGALAFVLRFVRRESAF